MQKILTLGVSAMALAALVAASSGCTGDDDDDAATGPGGIFNILVSTNGALAGAADETGNYAEFWTDVNETPTSQRDIPIDACAPLTENTSFEPTRTNVGEVTAVSGATTLTYEQNLTDEIYYSNATVASAPDDADYTANVGGAVLGTITVPSIPNPIAIAPGTRVITWTTMGADDAYVVVFNGGTGGVFVCHTADDGNFDFGSVLTTVTAGAAAVTGANYGEADLDGRTVTLIGQAGDPANEIFNYEFYDPS